MQTKRLQPLAYLTQREKRFFNSVVREFPPGHFTIADRTLLCAYSAYHFDVIDCRKRLRVDGMTIIGSAGTKVTNPDATFLKHTVALLCSLGTKLRLNPQQRTLPDHIDPARKKVADHKTYNPQLPNNNWKHQQRKTDLDS